MKYAEFNVKFNIYVTFIPGFWYTDYVGRPKGCLFFCVFIVPIPIIKKPPPGGGGFSYFRRFSKVAVFRAVKYTRLNPYSAVTT